MLWEFDKYSGGRMKRNDQRINRGKNFLEFRSQGSLNVKNCLWKKEKIVCETLGLQQNKKTQKIQLQKMLRASRQKSQVMCKYK